MKKREPSYKNPFYLKGTKYEKASSRATGKESGRAVKRQCKNMKNGKRCKNTLTADRYFNCKSCQQELPLDVFS